MNQNDLVMKGMQAEIKEAYEKINKLERENQRLKELGLGHFKDTCNRLQTIIESSKQSIQLFENGVPPPMGLNYIMQPIKISSLTTENKTQSDFNEIHKMICKLLIDCKCTVYRDGKTKFDANPKLLANRMQDLDWIGPKINVIWNQSQVYKDELNSKLTNPVGTDIVQEFYNRLSNY